MAYVPPTLEELRAYAHRRRLQVAQDVRILHAEDDWLLNMITLLDECDPQNLQRRETLKIILTSP